MTEDITSRKSSPILRWRIWVKWISIGVIVLSLLVLMRALPLDRFRDVLQSTVKVWGVWGPVVFGLIYAVAVVFLVPGSLLTLAGGAMFGLIEGTLIVSTSATIGAAMAFLISRYLARDYVQKQVQQSPKLSAVDQAIGEQGWKIVALLRLSPAVPFTLQNYLYGVTAIRFWPCVLTSWIAMLPGTFLYVYLGSLGSRAVAGVETSTAEWIGRGAGLLATVILTVYLTRLAKRAMQEKIEAPPENPPPQSKEPPAEHAAPVSSTGTLLWIIAAVMALALAIAAHLQKDSLRQFSQSSSDREGTCAVIKNDCTPHMVVS